MRTVLLISVAVLFSATIRRLQGAPPQGPDEGLTTAAQGPDEGLTTAPQGPDQGFTTAPRGPDQGLTTSRGGPDQGLTTTRGPDQGVTTGRGPDQGITTTLEGPEQGYTTSPEGPDALLTTTRRPVPKCVNDRAYCGQDLIALGYKRIDPKALYECVNGDALFLSRCPGGQQCTKVDNRAQCPCVSGKKYCGYELRIFNRVVEAGPSDQRLYTCTGAGHTLVENCPGRCIPNNNTGDAKCGPDKESTCVHGEYYCGSTLLHMGNNGWRPHTLYECQVNLHFMGVVERCPSGCIPNPTAHCSDEPSPEGPDAYTTTARPPTTASPRPEVDECDVLDPLSCNQNFSEACQLVGRTYRCVCPPGYNRLRDRRCLVINECYDANLNNCSINADCTDQLIGYTCQCRRGFVDKSPDKTRLPGRICKPDIYECTRTTKIDCSRNAYCVDLPDSYTCRCKPEFDDVSEYFNSLPGRVCIPKRPDPCANVLLNDCSPNATCNSTQLGNRYICQCKPGFIDVSPSYNLLPGRACLPYRPNPLPPGPNCDPSKHNADCPRPKICTEVMDTAAFCQCPPNMREVEGGICIESEPCSRQNVDCDPVNGVCVPTCSGFTCHCKPGFKDVSINPREPGRRCIKPKNFCANETLNNCSPFATCVANDFGYACHCLDGYADISASWGLPVGRKCIPAVSPCSAHTCHEHAKCIPTLSGYTCQCEEGYADVSIITRCPRQKTDLIFLVDGSGSITEPLFRRDVLPFVRDMTRTFDISPDATRIGVIQYSHKFRTEFNLNSFNDRRSLEQAILNIQYLKGGTSTGRAINYMLQNGFVERNGARPVSTGVSRFVILITDGRSNDDVITPARNARRQGISIYAVGVTREVRVSELEQIAGDPSKYTAVLSFRDLDAILAAKIQAEVCPEVPPLPKTCRSNADCKRSRNEICVNGTCGCPVNFCKSPKSGQCGPVITCDPNLNVNMTCPSPLSCKRTPYGYYRCACEGTGLSCEAATGNCLPPIAPRCVPPQTLNPSVQPPRCENCDPFCDARKNELCVKSATSNEFECVCKAGFQRDRTSKLCISHRCENAHSPVCDPNAECIDTYDTFFCTCPAGFIDVSPDPIRQPGRVCKKVENPCLRAVNNNCSTDATCYPLRDGAYGCSCNPGFYDLLPRPGHVCLPEVNECLSRAKNNCSENANCIDLKVGYSCICKPGFIDQDIRQPGRRCVPAPTVAPTTTPSTPPPGPRLCIPGTTYCGEHLTQMGYVNAQPNVLYECNDDQDAVYLSKCLADPKCVRSPTGNAYCPCRPGTKYCGHELQGLNVPMSVAISSNALYVCGVPIRKIDDCPGRCVPAGSLGSDRPSICGPPINSSCEIGKNYCGFQLQWQGITSWVPRPHTLYKCRTGVASLVGVTYVEHCRVGCDEKTGRCKPEPPVIKPPQFTTTTAKPTTTTPVPTAPPPVHQCHPLDPIGCNRTLSEVCVFTNGTSYQCVCPKPFTRLPNGMCLQANECANASLNICSINAECIDEQIGYKCKCKAGFIDASPIRLPGTLCKPDIADCRKPPSLVAPCDRNAECKQQGTVSVCQCKTGFVDVSEFFNLLPGRRCEPKEEDPCSKPTLNDCSPNAICQAMRRGSYTCLCKPGFVDVSPHVLTLPGRNCAPIKPVDPGSTNITCDPTLVRSPCEHPKVCLAAPGKNYAVCRCPANMQELEGGVCMTFNPCLNPNVDCDLVNGSCVMTLTGFTCQCKPGFKDVSPNPREPGRRCIRPINECASPTLNTCSSFATCVDRDVGYECQCLPGYADLSGLTGLRAGRRCVNGSNPCQGPNACDQHARCIPTRDGYVCQCEEGYADQSANLGRPMGRVCSLDSRCPDQPSDLIFLVDGSGSVTEPVFKSEVLPFVLSFSRLFQIGLDKTRIGFIQYSHKIQVEFHMNKYTNRAAFEDAVSKIKYLKGGTRTGKAIDYMTNYGFTVTNGTRPLGSVVQRIAIVITDGQSHDPVVEPAKNARRKGIALYAVGVTNDVQIAQLEAIGGSRARYTFVRAFKDLDDRLKARMQDEICPEVPPPPRPCTSNQECIRALNSICVNGTCGCPNRFCRSPNSGQCGPEITCDPNVNATCPSPLLCRLTPYGGYRCACPERYVCGAGSGACVPPEGPVCRPPQVLNPSFPRAVCENCDPFCDDRKNEVCIRERENYVCGCKPGFSRDPRSRLCISDRCNFLRPCHPNAHCANTFDGYVCYCPPGYRDDSPNPYEPGRICRKIEANPCPTSNCSVNATCVPSSGLGIFNCYCKKGYSDVSPFIQTSGRECKPDVNECASPTTNNCSANANCVDLKMGYTCVCKPGFVDVNIAIPGRKCLPPPTTPAPTTTPPPRPTLCTVGQIYCGHQLTLLKYSGADANTLYECNENNDAIYYNKCPAGTQCLSNGTSPHCTCKQGVKYCGHEFQMFNTPMTVAIEPNGIYVCKATIEQVDKCTGVCHPLDANTDRPARCGNVMNTTCNTGGRYCGSVVAFWLQNTVLWRPRPHSVYQCVKGVFHPGGMKYIEHCQNGCDPLTGQCKPGPIPEKPTGLSTTTSSPTTTTPRPPIVHECDPLDPSSCDPDLLEVCSLVGRVYKCVCPPGYNRLRDRRCLVTNECRNAAKNNCSRFADCIDQLIGYTCKCKLGFVDKSPNVETLPGRVCRQDVNECTKSTVDCDKNAKCIDTLESYACRCNPGFEDFSEYFNLLPGRFCVKERPNPCANITLNDCSPNAICQRTKVGLGYICQCKLGFIDVSPNVINLPGRACLPQKPDPNPPGPVCDAIKGDDDCPRPKVCVVEGAGDKGVCKCPPNTRQLEGGICLPFNPCTGQNVDCDQVNGACLPTLTGFTCQCKPGFKDVSPNLNEPGRRCVPPVSECTDLTLNDCSPNAKCTDKDVGHDCQCLPGYTDISVVWRKPLGHVCVNESNPCDSNTTNDCHEHAKCIRTLMGYTCVCEDGYADVSSGARLPVGRVCTLATNCLGQKTDFMFVIDGSTSVTDRVFKQDVLPFVRAISRLFDIGLGQTRLGVIQYSSAPRLEFALNKYTDNEALERAILNIPYLNGSTYTGMAIEFMIKNGYSDKRGARTIQERARRVAVVITDGQSFDDVIGPSNDARRHGIELYAVGITDEVRETELERIAGSKSKYTFVRSFRDLDDALVARIQKEVCPEPNPNPPPCSINKECKQSRNEICFNGTCACPQGFCRDPATGQCGPPIICDPTASNATCPSPLQCRLTPYGFYRCACPERHTCSASTGHCIPPIAPVCRPPQVLNPSLNPLRCENCAPFCDDRKNEACVKTVTGEFKCECKSRFVRRSLHNKLCESVKCNNSDCDPVAKCINTFESYFCTCPPGYIDVSPNPFRPGRRCKKIENPCITAGKHNCSTDATCIPSASGTYNCHCKDGFLDVLPKPGILCKPAVNECASASLNNCSQNAICRDLRIGYTCVCKEGYNDMNISLPGRQCVAPPTTTTTTTAATTTTPRPRPSICTPGVLYCGHQLIAMGYVGAYPDVLYECRRDGTASHYTKCLPGKCEFKAGHAYCQCELDGKYCGHELILMDTPMNIPVEPNSLYICKKPVRKLEDCSGSCLPRNGSVDSKCSNVINPSCEIGKTYCGLRIYWHGITFWTPRPHYVYKCTTGIMTATGMQFVQHCPNGCDPVTGLCRPDPVPKPPGACIEASVLATMRYNGSLSTTISNRTCQMWSVDTPHKNAYRNFKEPHNYCRNPDNWVNGPWCYTTDPAKRFEACFKKCEPSTTTSTTAPITTTTPTTPKPPVHQCNVLDPNACKKNNKSEICGFVNGTYKCVCPENYVRGPDGVCAAEKKCLSAATHNCSVNAECIEQPPKYTCKCKTGYVDASPDPTNFPGRICRPDTSNCEKAGGPKCDVNAECKKVGDSAVCQCKPGFVDVSAIFNLRPGQRCVPGGENPCSKPTLNDCSVNATCNQTFGIGYTCQCKDGFIDLSPIPTLPGRHCQPTTPGKPDPIPCNPRLPSSTCPRPKLCPEGNGTHSFCVCPPTMVTIVGGICLPIAACHSPFVDCDTANAFCIPTLTGFTCQCKSGFIDVSLNPREPGRRCVPPINECAKVTLNDCSGNAICTDEDIGYSCQCKAGFADISQSLGLPPGRLCVNVTNACLSPTTCHQHARCIPTIGGYTCQCRSGYADVSASVGLPIGRLCILDSKCPDQQTDLVFLVDGSTSIGELVFKQDVLPFVREFTKLFRIRANETHVGLIQYSHKVKDEFPLNKYLDQASLEAAIMKISMIKGGTRTGTAIEYMTRFAYEASVGGRPLTSSARRIAVIITDGQSSDDVITPSRNARRQGISMYAVGVTPAVRESELEQIAGDRSKYTVVHTFTELDYRLRAKIQDEICPETTPPIRPCRTHANCSQSRNEICVNGTCSCPPTFCRNPATGQCGLVRTCDPAVNITCPSPFICQRTPHGVYRCACLNPFVCDAGSGSCVPPTPPICTPPHLLNPSLPTPACEICNPYCDHRKNEICVKDSGRFRCVCKPGFVLDVKNRICISNICNTTAKPCHPDAKCDNTLDGVICTCPPGYIDKSRNPREPGRICVKIPTDPCAGNNCSKDAVAIPVGLGFCKCACKPGFVDIAPWCPLLAGRDCRPLVNECEKPTTNNCSQNAHCIDLRVGYTCICKSGFVDQDLSLPGRKCVLPPTPAPVTTTTARPPPPTCIPGRMYCGQKLIDLGYTNIVVNAIYECNGDREAMLYEKCGEQTCDSSTLRPFCPCEPGVKYCGHQLINFNIPSTFPIESHSLYVCRKPLEKVEQCTGRCVPGNEEEDRPAVCHTATGTTCVVGNRYCGKEIIWQGIKTWRPDHQSLYLCKSSFSMDGMRFVRECRTGCIHDKVAQCDPSPLPGLPPAVKRTCTRPADVANYNGTKSRTISGKICQNWNVQAPHRHGYTSIGSHNYCRHLGNEPNGPWCYTTDPNTQWEPCFGFCDHKGECSRLYDIDYNSNKSVTMNGLQCQNWNVQAPHRHNYASLGNHNHCRNPDNHPGGPWCFTTNPTKRWESCFGICDSARH